MHLFEMIGLACLFVFNKKSEQSRIIGPSELLACLFSTIKSRKDQRCWIIGYLSRFVYNLNPNIASLWGDWANSFDCL